MAGDRIHRTCQKKEPEYSNKEAEEGATSDQDNQEEDQEDVDEDENEEVEENREVVEENEDEEEESEEDVGEHQVVDIEQAEREMPLPGEHRFLTPDGQRVLDSSARRALRLMLLVY